MIIKYSQGFCIDSGDHACTPISKLHFRLDEKKLHFIKFDHTHVRSPIDFFVSGKDTKLFCDLEVSDYDKTSMHLLGIVNAEEVFEVSICTFIDRICFEIRSDREVGVMWPVFSKEVFFGNEMLRTDNNRVQAYHKDVADTFIPVVHQVLPNRCLSTFATGDPVFHLFNHNYERQCNVVGKSTSDDTFDVTFRASESKRGSLSWWYERNGFARGQICVPEYIDKDSMQRIIYNGHEIVSPKAVKTRLLDFVKIIQNKLTKKDISTCIIGSMAMYLQGVKINVADTDMMLESKAKLDQAIELLKEDYQVKISEDPKWSSCSARIISEDGHVDLCYLNRFDWKRGRDKIRDFHVMNKPNLLLMKLTGEYERKTILPGFHLLEHKNYASIMSLLYHARPFLYPFFDDYLCHHKNGRFRHLHKIVTDAEWSRIEFTINDPLLANAFVAPKQIIMPVINPGDKTHGKITIGKEFKYAKWLPLEQDIDQMCKTSIQDNSTIVEIRDIIDLGVLILYNEKP